MVSVGSKREKIPRRFRMRDMSSHEMLIYSTKQNRFIPSGGKPHRGLSGVAHEETAEQGETEENKARDE